MTTLSCSLATAQQRPEEATIVLGSGCFWGAEKRLASIDGVIDAVSGYADGRGVKPTYDEIKSRSNRHNTDNYAEVVKVTYNPGEVSLEYLLKYFFEHHDPTQGNRQGNDIGTQYRSTILYQAEEEKELAERIRDRYQKHLSEAGFGEITTKIAVLDEFHRAEEYHQDYLTKNPNGYCPDHATGVVFDKSESSSSAVIDNSALLKGKQIVVLDAPFCPYCEAFKKDVTNSYQGNIPLHYRRSDQLQGLQLTTELWATPTIFFIEDGKEVVAYQGYMNPEEFYRALGAFKLGKESTAFKVAFDNGTEQRFCRKYDAFKNTGEGVFVDAFSGAELFDTKDRFNSGSGWLSFTQALPGSTVEIEDNSYGMQRIEVRAQQSGIHLGHVFNDGPNGQRRFCINATVLEFKPR